jgi:hypothetical protein
MNIIEAIKKIQEKWYDIPTSRQGNDTTSPYRSMLYGTDIEAVWLGVSDKCESYDVDEEWVGVRQDGEITWAYASGCSCWDGSYRIDGHCHVKDVKTATMNHPENMAVDWAAKIIEFASGLN